MHSACVFMMLASCIAAASGVIATEYIESGQRHIDGSVKLGRWKKVTTLEDPRIISKEAHDVIVYVDLKALGLWPIQALSVRGYANPARTAPPDLYFRGQRMVKARWPNVGWARTGEVLLSSGNQRFRLPELPDGIDLSSESELWSFGYWSADWDGVALPITISARTPTEAELLPPGPPFGVAANSRFFIFNSLKLLDSPGEWYIDVAKGLLFFWPPDMLRDNDVSLTWETEGLRIENKSDVTVRNLTLTMLRGPALIIKNSKNVQIRNCNISNIGSSGIVIEGGSNVSIEGCVVRGTGDSAIHVRGGDRDTLERSGHEIRSTTISDFGWVTRTYTAAIWASGVGVVLDSNVIRNGPHMGIMLQGNDHLVMRNIISNVVGDTGDAGAIYMGRDWTARGSVIIENVFCNIRSPYKLGAMGVFLDDLTAGISVLRNRFLNVQRAILIGGGSDNIVKGNQFDNVDQAIVLDARGMDKSSDYLLSATGYDMRRRLSQVPSEQDLYRSRYPMLQFLADAEELGIPRRNIIEGNRGRMTDFGWIDPRVRMYQLIVNNDLPSIGTPGKDVGGVTSVTSDCR